MVTTNDLTTPVTSIPADACRGELLIKFKPEVADLLDQAQTRSERGVMTRSSIPTVDEVLDVAGAYHFERIFPVDVRHEERTRKGLHLWYLVRFDKDADLQKVAQDLSNVGEIAAIEYNRTIKRAYNTQKRPLCSTSKPNVPLPCVQVNHPKHRLMIRDWLCNGATSITEQ